MSTAIKEPAIAGQPNGTARTLCDVKPGDIVFVVRQNRRRESPVDTSEVKVSRVGRKYGYFERGYREEKFELATGTSVHDADCNARANGLGFDVYLSAGEYLVKKLNDDQMARLQSRLVRQFGELVELPPDVVSKIHGILDDSGIA